MKVFVIAEAGVNHNGSLTWRCAWWTLLLRQADAVKFQTFTAERLFLSMLRRPTTRKRQRMLRNLNLRWPVD